MEGIICTYKQEEKVRTLLSWFETNEGDWHKITRRNEKDIILTIYRPTRRDNELSWVIYPDGRAEL